MKRRYTRGPLLDAVPVDTSTLFPPATVTMGSVILEVTNTRDTVRGSHFRVEHPRKGGADVRLDFKTGRYACTNCGALDCLHADAARRYVAMQQPIDPTATGGAHGSGQL